MATFDLLAVINLKSSYKKAADFMAERDYDCIFLPLPVAVESSFKPGLFKIKIKPSGQGILREPEDGQLIRAMQPLFEYLSRRKLKVHCYKADLDWSFSRDFTTQILLLTLRSKLQGIKVEDWIKLLAEEAIFAEEAICREAYLLSAKARAKNACLAGYGAGELKSSLEKMGHEVKVIKLDVSAAPLDKLRAEVKRKMKTGDEVSRELAEKLIAMHLKFTDLILEKGYEEAYKHWLEVVSEGLAEEVSEKGTSDRN
ncbi:MAG: hypothetical protein QXL78_05900 [Methanocellales archaeon]